MEGISARPGIARTTRFPANIWLPRPLAHRAPDLLPQHRRAKTPLRPPYINQRSPDGCPADFDGSASCGPTCMAMIARLIGYRRDLSDYQLIVRFGEIAGTTLESGTEVEGICRLAGELGRSSKVVAGSDVGRMRRSLARGSMVVANGEYYAMPPHEDPSLREGHFILAYGLAPNGDFLVHDSEDPAVETVTPHGMKCFLCEHDKGGFQIEIELAPLMTALERVLLTHDRSAAGKAVSQM